MSLGKRLKLARERQGLSQIEAAKSLDISNVVLNRYEKDDRRPDPETIKKLADIYEVTTDYLLGRTDEPNPQSLESDDLEGLMYLRLQKSGLSESTKQQFIKAFKENLKLIEELEKEEENKETTT